MKTLDRLILALCFAGLAVAAATGCAMPAAPSAPPPVMVNGDGDVSITYQHDNTDGNHDSDNTTNPVAK